jgi:hypothetical protein
MNTLTLQDDKFAKELVLMSESDFLLASKIPIEDKELWFNSKGSPRNWNHNRLTNWSLAVEKRVINLYDNYYSILEFNQWNDTNTTKEIDL